MTPRLLLRGYVAGVGLAGLLTLGFLIARGGLEIAISPLFWTFVVLITLAELRPVQQKRQSTVVVWTLSTPFIFALLLYQGMVTAALVAGLASVLADLIARRAWDRVVFNFGQYVLMTAAAGAVLQALGYVPGPLLAAESGVEALWPAVPAGLVFLVAGDLLVAVLVAMAQGRSVLAVAHEGLNLSLPTNGALLAIAPVVAVLASISPVLLAPFIVLLFAIHHWTTVAIEKEDQAKHDLLTGLPNRVLFSEHVGWALDEATRSAGPAVVLLDLDHFKDINDTLGHQAGDGMLRVVGERLSGALSEGSVVARLGGDEFAVLLPAIDEPETAVEAAVAVMAMLRQPVVVGGFSLNVSASAGIATYPEHGRDAETLLRRAEVAMYVAKAKHGAIEVYRPQRDGHSRRRLSVIQDLRRAVDDGELKVAYQPKADLATGAIVGMEALVRWDHLELGPVSPDEFVPLAERTGLMAPITEQVLEMAMADCARWHRSRFPLHVAVNLSPQVIFDRGLQRTMDKVVSQWGLEARWLELEITESTIMGDPEQAAAVLNEYAEMGIRLAIDDFGTGYSSLAMLKQLPVHELKVDRSFVRNIVEDSSDAAIVRTTVQLAHSMGMTVCAEGVETVQAWDRLVELECDLAQGFLLSRPQYPADLMAWLLARIPGPDIWTPTAHPPGLRSAEVQTPVVPFLPRKRAT